MIDPLVLTLLLMNIILLAGNVMLFCANLSLKNDLYRRDKWHERELQKWRQRL